MSLLPDGRVAYLLRKPRGTGATHLVLDPVHFLARIAALVPPPRYPLTRLAGVLAPHSTWRAAVVKYGRDETQAPSVPAPATKKRRKKKEADVTAAQAPAPSSARTSLGAGIVKPVGARIDWASLLRRIYLEDVLSLRRAPKDHRGRRRAERHRGHPHSSRSADRGASPSREHGARRRATQRPEARPAPSSEADSIPRASAARPPATARPARAPRTAPGPAPVTSPPHATSLEGHSTAYPPAYPLREPSASC